MCFFKVCGRFGESNWNFSRMRDHKTKFLPQFFNWKPFIFSWHSFTFLTWKWSVFQTFWKTTGTPPITRFSYTAVFYLTLFFQPKTALKFYPTWSLHKKRRKFFAKRKVLKTKFIFFFDRTNKCLSKYLNLLIYYFSTMIYSFLLEMQFFGLKVIW